MNYNLCTSIIVTIIFTIQTIKPMDKSNQELFNEIKLEATQELNQFMSKKIDAKVTELAQSTKIEDIQNQDLIPYIKQELALANIRQLSPVHRLIACSTLYGVNKISLNLTFKSSQFKTTDGKARHFEFSLPQFEYAATQ